jgi:hypothetical protein
MSLAAVEVSQYGWNNLQYRNNSEDGPNFRTSYPYELRSCQLYTVLLKFDTPSPWEVRQHRGGGRGLSGSRETLSGESKILFREIGHLNHKTKGMQVLPRISPRGRVRAPAIPPSPRTKSLLSAAMGPELPSLFFFSLSTRNPLRHPLFVPESLERERFFLATKSRRLRVGCWREAYVMLHNDVVIVDDCSIGVHRGVVVLS